MPRDVGVIVVAAGRSSRLGGGAAKQYRPVAGVPLVLRAVRPFAAHPEVAHLVLVLPATDVAAPPAFLAEHRGEGLTLVAGGAERADSVAAGIAPVLKQRAVDQRQHAADNAQESNATGKALSIRSR